MHVAVVLLIGLLAALAGTHCFPMGDPRLPLSHDDAEDMQTAETYWEWFPYWGGYPWKHKYGSGLGWGFGGYGPGFGFNGGLGGYGGGGYGGGGYGGYGPGGYRPGFGR